MLSGCWGEMDAWTCGIGLVAGQLERVSEEPPPDLAPPQLPFGSHPVFLPSPSPSLGLVSSINQGVRAGLSEGLPAPRSTTQGQRGSGKCSLQRGGIRGQALPNTVRARPQPDVQTDSSSQAAPAPAGLILWGHCPGELFSAGSSEAVGPAPGQGGPGLAPHSLCVSPSLRRHALLWA